MVDPAIAPSLGLDRPRGVVLTRIYPHAAADDAGLVKGDVVLTVDGMEVTDLASLNYRLALHRLRDRVEVAYWRDGKLNVTKLVVEAAPDEPPSDVTALSRGPLSGVTVANLSPAFNEQLGIDMFAAGVVVLEVQAGSRGGYMRLRPGDVLAAVNDRPVDNVADLERALRSTLRSLAVKRDDRTFVLSVAG
jgi:S1-C subfamily serine protease